MLKNYENVFNKNDVTSYCNFMLCKSKLWQILNNGKIQFKLDSYFLFVWFDHLQLVIRGKIELECFSYNAKDEWMSCLTKKTKQKTETIVELGNIIMMSNVLCKKNHNTILIQMWNYLLIVFSIRFMLEVICWPFITSQQNWSAKVIRSGQKQCICVNESCK